MGTLATATDSKSLMKTVPMKNPFGPVVGNMLHIYSCDYDNQRGQLFVAAKAVCFKRTPIFGIEIRVIIPWDNVTVIDRSDHGVISITTNEDELHQMEGFDEDVIVVENALNNVWKECDLPENDERNRKAVRRFYNRVSLMPTSNDSDTESSDEETTDPSEPQIDPFEDDQNTIASLDDVDISKMWTELWNSNDNKYTEDVAVVSSCNR